MDHAPRPIATALRLLKPAVGVLLVIALVLGVITALLVRRFTSLDQRVQFLNTLNPKFEKRWVKGRRSTLSKQASEQDDRDS